MNLSPHIQLVLVVLVGIATLLGPSGFAVWWRMQGQKGLDRSQKREIDTRVASMTDDRLSAQKQEFDRQVGELRADAVEDRRLAAERFKRLVALEKFADRVVVFYRKADDVFGRLVSLIPGGWDTVGEHNIVMPEPPTVPTNGD